MDLSRVEIDSRKHAVVFHGTCLEMRPVCQAMCCSIYNVNITDEEFASGQYDAEAFCKFTEKECRDLAKPCLNRQYQLAKREDKSCVYLQDHQCSIYDVRPNVCRDYQCQGGWQLNSVIPMDNGLADPKPPELNRATFTSMLNEDAVFVLHPLIKLHTIFYIKPRSEIIFVKEIVGGCGKFNTRDHFDYPQLGDAQILMLIELFNYKESLRQVYGRFCSQSENLLTLPEFYEIVWLLNKHNIALDSSNFQGMLRGMGAIG
jgi:Fe-S-cluster containining protein